MSFQEEIAKHTKISGQGDSLQDSPAAWVEVRVKDPLQLSKVLEIASQHSCLVLTKTKINLEQSIIEWLSKNFEKSPKLIFLDLSDMTEIVEHVVEDQVISVRTGMTIRNLNNYLKKTKQWLPCIGKNENSTILNMIESGDTGPLCTGYGAAKNLVLGLETCLADGSQIKSGGKIVKNVTGYDLTKLFVGSYSWLGVSHTAHLRLFALPQNSCSLIVPVSDLASIPNTVSTLVNTGYPLSGLEVIDSRLFSTIVNEKDALIKQFSDSKINENSAILILTGHGYQEELEPSLQEFQSLLETNFANSKLVKLETDSTNWLIEKIGSLANTLDCNCINTNLSFANGVALTEKLNSKNSDYRWMSRPVHGSFSILVKNNKTTVDIANMLNQALDKLNLTSNEKSSLAISLQNNLCSSTMIDLDKDGKTELKKIKSSIKTKFDQNGILNPLVTF